MRTTSTPRPSTARTTASPRRRAARLGAAALAGAALFAGLGATAASAESVVPKHQIDDLKACPPTTIRAKIGQTVIHGTCGDDLIFVYDNNATVYAGAGNDDIRAGWTNTPSGKTEVHGGKGDDSIHINPGKKLVAYGDEGDDVIEGGDMDDFIQGGAGHDDIYGGNGANVMNGNEGSDMLNSIPWKVESKPDLVIGGDGFDVAVYKAGDVLGQVEAAQPGI